MYYEIHGNWRPLILLHGGVGASEMFGPLLSSLAENRKVVAVHLQAHGQTADIDRPLRFKLIILSGSLVRSKLSRVSISI
jgi:pimeloyl-ACP methyl ester carboxylesterase